jgi:hypothetical protein
MNLVGDKNAKAIPDAVDRTARIALTTCFQGSTASQLSRYALNKYTTLQKMLDAIDAHLIPASATDYAQQVYDEAAQNEGEDLLKWHGRLYTLFI